jgi:ATP phosphoribosyltransferase
MLLDRIAAAARARAFKEVRTRFPGCNDTLLSAAKEQFGVATPFGGPTSSGMLTLHCPPREVHALANFLRDHGAENIAVAHLDYIFARENALFTRLEAAI